MAPWRGPPPPPGWCPALLGELPEELSDAILTRVDQSAAARYGETGRLPRVSRVQLLLGYQVLSTAILHWYLVSHELGPLEQLTEAVPGTGTALLGQPLLLLLLLTALAPALSDTEVTADDEEPAGSVGFAVPP